MGHFLTLLHFPGTFLNSPSKLGRGGAGVGTRVLRRLPTAPVHPLCCAPSWSGRGPQLPGQCCWLRSPGECTSQSSAGSQCSGRPCESCGAGSPMSCLCFPPIPVPFSPPSCSSASSRQPGPGQRKPWGEQFNFSGTTLDLKLQWEKVIRLVRGCGTQAKIHYP